MSDVSDAEGYLIEDVGAEAIASREAAEARRRANLVPFKPGESGNPLGRAPGGLYVREWINQFLACHDDGTSKYTAEDLERIVACARSEPPAKVMAARRVLGAMQDGQRYVRDRSGEIYHAGTDPEPGRDFDRIMDRLLGKPANTTALEVSQGVSGDDEEMAELRQIAKTNPAILEKLVALLHETREADGSAAGDAGNAEAGDG